MIIVWHYIFSDYHMCFAVWGFCLLNNRLMFSSLCDFFQGCPRPPRSVKPNWCQPPSLSPFSPMPTMCESLYIVSKWLSLGWYEPPFHIHTHTLGLRNLIVPLYFYCVDCIKADCTLSIQGRAGPSPPLAYPFTFSPLADVRPLILDSLALLSRCSESSVCSQ